MTEEKFIYDSKTVLKFIQYYCDNKHESVHRNKDSLTLSYNTKDLEIALDYSLCKECEQALAYSHARLQECPHEEKPSCRKCDDPCYEKKEWKLLAKIMKYSGMSLGLLKIKKIFKLDRRNND
jgi:hypothetical protein